MKEGVSVQSDFLALFLLAATVACGMIVIARHALQTEEMDRQ
ncbi:hypothetical protein [Effusibacillus pohliae]|nr:hypothetical protein [Effusibacillus pohliae]